MEHETDGFSHPEAFYEAMNEIVQEAIQTANQPQHYNLIREKYESLKQVLKDNPKYTDKRLLIIAATLVGITVGVAIKKSKEGQQKSSE